jgi:phosphoribosyl-ATP pyrophosphohydrolase
MIKKLRDIGRCAGKKSVTIPIHDFPYVTAGIQVNKIKEECKELIDAYSYENDDRTIEEATDLIQATFNLIEMLSPNGVHEALQKHSEKMAERGYAVKYELDILREI